MMRRTLRLFLLAGGAMPFAMADAQTLTQASSVPAIGHTESRTYYSQFGASGLATTGTGNTWDVSGATPFGTSALITYRAPGDSPYAATYPTTTICMQRSDGGGQDEWRHYHVDATIAELLGANTDVFDGGRTFCTFPFSLGNSFTDTYSINGGSPNTETDEYVASGELLTPWGTVPNVVMVSVNGGLAYYFYSADNVLDAIGSYMPDFSADIWRVESGTAVEEQAQLALGVWPVPSADRVTLSVPFMGASRYEVMDATGRRVHSGTIAGSTMAVEVGAWPPGMYSVVATSGRGGIATGRLIVQ